MTSPDRDPVPVESDGTAHPTETGRGAEPDPAVTESRSRSFPGARGPRRERSLPFGVETLVLLAVAVGLAVLVKTFLLQVFYIPSESMEPGLVENDRIVVQKVSYWGGGTPERGDVVVFQDPGDWLGEEETRTASNPVTKGLDALGLYPGGGHLVKRVVGVAGDTIVCCDEAGRISVNGLPMEEDAYVLDEKNIKCRGPMLGDCDWQAGPVPEGTVFVMGDNRGHSADSSFQMCAEGDTACVPGDEFVPVDDIVGKVMAVFWPVGHAGLLERPDVFADVPDPS